MLLAYFCCDGANLQYNASLTDLVTSRQYADKKNNPDEYQCHQTVTYLRLCADGLLDYFNASLRTHLLYKQEWSVYDALKERNKNTDTQGERWRARFQLANAFCI